MGGERGSWLLQRSLMAGLAVLASAGLVLALLSLRWSGAAAVLDAVGIAGGIIGFLCLIEVGRLNREAREAARHLDLVSSRLVSVEAATPDPSPDAGLRTLVSEVAAEIGVLGGIVKELADTVAKHDRDIAKLTSGAGRAGRDDHATARLRPRLGPSPAPTKSEAEPVLPSLWPRPAAADGEAAAGPPHPAAPGQADTDRAALEALSAGRIELHLQPAVSLPQRKVRFYEVLSRLRLAEGGLLSPAEFMPVLERSGRIVELDRLVASRAATVARHLERRGSDALVSCNIAPASIGDAGFLRAFEAAIEDGGSIAGRLMVELPQRAWRNLDASMAGALTKLKARGVGLVLDGASDLRLDPSGLAERQIGYLKLSADLLLRSRAGGLDIALEDLAAALARAGVRLVAERVEREEDVPDLIDLDVPLAQGFLFAPPRPVRAEVLSEIESPRPAIPQMPAPAPLTGEPGPARMPLRAFLRRAG